MPLTRVELKIYSSLDRKSKREEHGLFIAEGIKTCKELLSSKMGIKTILCTKEHQHLFENSVCISNKYAQRISNQKNHSGIIAIGELPKKRTSKLNFSKDIIVLDGINDPGNLGTIIRTLDWFGFTQLVCSTKSVDAFNPKTIMASMGSVFRLRPMYFDVSILLKNSTSTIYGTFTEGNSIYQTSFSKPCTIVFGNESNGISPKLHSLINSKISIPGVGGAESINLSNSCSIVVSELIRQRLLD